MIQTLTYIMALMTSMTFIQMNHPLAMGLTLLVQTTLICLITGMVAKSFWFSYVLFLIFLGGMLVLFIYVTSLASNEMFTLSFKSMMLVSMLLGLLLVTATVTDSTLLYTFLPNNEMAPITETPSYIQENTMNLMKLYNYPTNMITMVLINYLLISLIAIVKITNVFKGPLRPMN